MSVVPSWPGETLQYHHGRMVRLRYLVHGLVVATDSPLPIPELVDGDDDGDADVVVHLTTGRASAAEFEATFSRADDPAFPWVSETWSAGGRVRVHFASGPCFELRPDEAWLVADESGDPDLVAHLLLDHVLPRVVSLRGDLMVHGSGAVGPSGAAHLFLAQSGSGKSTLAVALAAHGWGLVDDDGIRVQSVDGAFVVTPGYPMVRLLPDASDAVLPGVAPGAPMAIGHAKRRFAVTGPLSMAGARSPIAAIHLLGWTHSEKPSSESVGFSAAVGEVSSHAFHMSVDQSKMSSDAFGRAAAVCAAVPVRRLLRPHGHEHTSRVIALLSKLDSELAADLRQPE